MIRVQQSAKGLGSDLLITLVANDETSAKSIIKMLWAQINSFEQRFSRFIENSETSEFNKKAGTLNRISPEFKKLLHQSKKYALETDGLFNPLVLPLLQKAGYKGSWPKVALNTKAIDFSYRKPALATEIKIYKNSARIPCDSAIDFGGIGKGYLLDSLSTWLLKKGYDNFWISLGGDIVCHGFDIDDTPWTVIIESTNGASDIGKIVNSKGSKMAIASSGITKRKGVGWHHIIDPRINMPAKTDILVATVVTAKATDADIDAKNMIILGSKQAETFIKSKKYYATALQISHNGNVVVHKFGDVL